MPEAKAETEQQLEEGVRPGAVAQLERKGFDLATSITKATRMAAKLVGAAEADLGRIEEEVLSLAAGTMTTDQLVAKYGLTTDSEAAQKVAQLAQVTNSIKVKVEEVKVQTQGLELERTKLLRAKKTFQVIGTAAEVQDAANDARHKWQVVEVNAEGRADELDYRRERRSLTKTNYDGDIAYRNSWNELEKSDRKARLSHKEQMNQLFERLRTATRGVLEAKANKRTFVANADLGANNSGGQQ